MKRRAMAPGWCVLLIAGVLLASCGRKADGGEPPAPSAAGEKDRTRAGTETASETPAAVPEGRRLQVRVDAVDGTSGKVQVYLVPWGDPTDREVLASQGCSLSWLSRLELAVATSSPNDQGIADFEAPPPGWLQVVAVQGRRVADALVDTACTDKVTLRLEEDHPLRVRVTDSVGKPLAGVRVGLVARKKSPAVRALRPTDAKGEVLFHHPRRWLHPLDRSSRDAIMVVASGLFQSPPTTLVTSFDDVATLVLPPFASLRLKRRGGGAGTVHLAVESRGQKQSFVLASMPDMRRRVSFSWPDGLEELVLPHVGLDLDLRLQWQRGVHELELPVTLRGPGQQGEVVSFEIPPAKPLRRVTMICADSAGAPLAGHRARFVLVDAKGRVGRFTVDLDEEGMASLPVSTWDAGGCPSLISLTCRMADRHLVLSGGALRKVWREDVLHLTPKPHQLLAAGCVKDGQGRPLAGVFMQLELLRKSGYWAVPAPMRVATNGAGRFELRGASLQGIFRVRARRHDFEDAFTSPVSLGTRDLELRMELKAHVQGRVQVDALLGRHSLLAAFRQRGQTAEIVKPLRPEKDGALGIRGAWLVPGTYDFIIMENGVVGRLQKIEGIRVPFRGDQTPPKLKNVDLRGRFRSLTLQILDRRGQPMAFVLVELATAEKAALSYRQVRGTDDQGRVTFLAAKGPLDAKVIVNQEESFFATVEADVARQILRRPAKSK